MVGDGWLHDRKLANSLLDSFSRYAFVARFIYQHKDFCTGLLPALLKKPDVIRAQWRRCERGEDADDAIKAAMSLSDSLGDGLSCGRIDVSRQEIAQFITAATGSTSLAAAHREERDDRHAVSTHMNDSLVCRFGLREGHFHSVRHQQHPPLRQQPAGIGQMRRYQLQGSGPSPSLHP